MKTLPLAKLLNTKQERQCEIRPVVLEQGANKLWQLFSIIWYTLLHWRKLRIRQHTRGQLLDLTNEQLRDIGLTRYEVEREARKWFWE